MLTSALQTLRQPRYAALAALMLAVALICVAAGTWQIVRFEDKVRANDALRANIRRAPAPVARLLPLTSGSTSSSVAEDRVRFRIVTATGTFDTSHQALVRNRTIDGVQGFLVLTPFRTGGGDLLVVRGFVATPASGNAPTSVPAPPSGRVRVSGRVQLAETRTDAAAQLPGGQVESINPAEQQLRLGAPVFDGYVELLAQQPGTRGLSAVPDPDPSNPAGGAVEPQHFAYIIQWYLFAVLALAAPFAMARGERRQRDGELDDERNDEPVDPAVATQTQQRAAKLAERYGGSMR